MKRNEAVDHNEDIPIKLIHKGVYKETKICPTCNIVKPFRSHHCNDCGNCIYKFDHHCPWIGGCVGGRNYIFFFLFLCLFNIKNIFLGIFCIIHVIYISKDTTNEEKEDKKWIAKQLIKLIPSLLTIIFIGITMAFTIGLNIYHIKLIIRNMSTKEEIKKLINIHIGNPYNKGCANNCKEFWNKHKSYENNFTVKELRVKSLINDNNNNQNNSIKKKPKIMPFGYSKKEIELLNKNKANNNINNINNEAKMEQNNEINDKIDINNNKIEDNNIVIVSEESKKSKDSKDKQEQEKILKENNDDILNNKSKEEDGFSIGNISDENDNYKSKVCNTSVKNKSNLDKIDNMELGKISSKVLLTDKKISINKDDKGYQIAQKRLEELSSEISIHQELKSSMSFPNENSLNSSLSQN